MFQIEGNALLIGVEKEKQAAPFPTRLISKKGGQGPGPVPCAGLFYLNDLGAVVGQQLCAVRAGDVVGEVKHTDTTQGMLHLVIPSSAGRVTARTRVRTVLGRPDILRQEAVSIRHL